MDLVDVSVYITIEGISEFMILEIHRERFNLIWRANKKLFISFRCEFVNELLKFFAIIVFGCRRDSDQDSLKRHSVNDFSVIVSVSGTKPPDRWEVDTGKLDTREEFRQERVLSHVLILVHKLDRYTILGEISYSLDRAFKWLIPLLTFLDH